jgi:hypothetical protein
LPFLNIPASFQVLKYTYYQACLLFFLSFLDCGDRVID